MKTKIGGGGRLQNYDSYGRYAKTIYGPAHISKKEKNKIREVEKRKSLYERAYNSRDKYLFDVYEAIENELPGFVLGVNEKRIDTHGTLRKFDIIGRKCIIEVKSGQASGIRNQIMRQKEYCDLYNKKYFLYAPEINKMRFYEYGKYGIKIVKDLKELVEEIKENCK